MPQAYINIAHTIGDSDTNMIPNKHLKANYVNNILQ